MDSKISKCSKLVEIIKKLFINVPRNTLLKIYKSFIRPYLDYADIVYDKPNKKSFKNKVKNVQNIACLAIAGAIQGTSWGCLYHELGLKSPSDNRWFRKLVFFYEIVNDLVRYLNLNKSSTFFTRTSKQNTMKEIRIETKKLKYSFFPFCKTNGIKCRTK